jgi:hypothetical protein
METGRCPAGSETTLKLTLRNITPSAFRSMPDRFHTFAILCDGERHGTVMFHYGQHLGDPPNRWKALIQKPIAFRRGANRMPVIARFEADKIDGLLPQVRAFMEKC